MHENRTTYPEKKAKMYQSLQETIPKYKSVALVRMDKVRASQMLGLRKKLKGEVVFFSIKDRVAIRALEGLSVPGIKELIREITGQCMLLLSDMSPFRLNMLLAKNKTMMAARGGDVADMDVVVAARNTGIAPGPMLTEFKEAGIPTKIDQGTIWIAKDTTPVKKGEVINEKLASMLGKLDIKPIEAGIALHAALDGGLAHTREELVVDVEAVADSIAAAHQEAVNLSVEAAYVTEENATQVLAKAAAAARALSVESGYMTEQTSGDILARAHAQARSLISGTEYTPS